MSTVCVLAVRPTTTDRHKLSSTVTPRGFEINADLNAALNMLTAGYSLSACGTKMARAAAVKQEPACGSAQQGRC
ncbi:MAG: hypothetical protein K5657_01500 [Desulfovibrio sp.]|nr:hypothetical protein [Desulfovibrio sp.]